jgi:hypothetical protein
MNPPEDPFPDAVTELLLRDHALLMTQVNNCVTGASDLDLREDVWSRDPSIFSSIMSLLLHKLKSTLTYFWVGSGYDSPGRRAETILPLENIRTFEDLGSLVARRTTTILSSLPGCSSRG